MASYLALPSFSYFGPLQRRRDARHNSANTLPSAVHPSVRPMLDTKISCLLQRSSEASAVVLLRAAPDFPGDAERYRTSTTARPKHSNSSQHLLQSSPTSVSNYHLLHRLSPHSHLPVAFFPATVPLNATLLPLNRLRHHLDLHAFFHLTSKQINIPSPTTTPNTPKPRTHVPLKARTADTRETTSDRQSVSSIDVTWVDEPERSKGDSDVRVSYWR